MTAAALGGASAMKAAVAGDRAQVARVFALDGLDDEDVRHIVRASYEVIDAAEEELVNRGVT